MEYAAAWKTFGILALLMFFVWFFLKITAEVIKFATMAIFAVITTVLAVTSDIVLTN